MTRRIVVAVDEVDADTARLETLSLQLQEELLSTGADDVTGLTTGEAPPGTRGLDLAAAGALVVSVANSVAALSQVEETVRRRLGRGSGGRTVELTIGDRHLRLTHASAEKQTCLISAFLEAAEP